MTERRAVLGLIALALVLLSPACSRWHAESDVLDRELDAITGWLRSAGVRYVSSPARSRTSWSRSASWQTETDLAWSKLVDVLRSTAPIGYDRCDERDHKIICRRTLQGDSLYIEVQPTADGPPLRLAVSVRATAS